MLLIDEIDRADEEFEAFLLELLGEFQVTIPELGTLRAAHRPFVILTSNRTRDLSDALRRRCLYLWQPYPSFETEVAILNAHLPDIDARLSQSICRVMVELRALPFNKPPGIAESLDWARALLTLHRGRLDGPLLERTLGCILKDSEDWELFGAHRRELTRGRWRRFLDLCQYAGGSVGTQRRPTVSPHPDLPRNLLAFAASLRAAGFTVGPLETQDALRALTITDLGNMARVRDALSLIFCTRHDQEALFNLLFRAFFLPAPTKRVPPEAQAKGNGEGGDHKEAPQRRRSGLEGEGRGSGAPLEFNLNEDEDAGEGGAPSLRALSPPSASRRARPPRCRRRGWTRC